MKVVLTGVAQMPASHSKTEDGRRGGEASQLTLSLGGVATAQTLSWVNGLLAGQSLNKFPATLENFFQAEASEARARHFTLTGLSGVLAYNFFLITDRWLLPDLFMEAVIVQLAFVTPIVFATLYLIHRRIVKPEWGVTFSLILIYVSIMVFYWKSRSDYAAFLIFTVPACLVFGNIVLPLPFKMSIWFTVFCLGTSAIAVLCRPGWDLTLSVFAILTNASVGLYMLFGTFRSEQSDRRAFLFNLRERIRADVLAEKNEQLRSLSETDGLTGVANRRYFDGALEQLWQAATQAAEPLALFFVDIDHFKRLNDTYGHQKGDHCLVAVAQCLQSHLMPNAILARYGGEEFVVLLPGVNEHYARSCAEVLRSAVGDLELIADDGSPIVVSVSIGMSSTIPTPAQRHAALVSAADQALYRAKTNGRNRVENAVPRASDAADTLETDGNARLTA